MKFNLKSAFIAALIVGMLMDIFMLISCAYNGEWEKFGLAAAFEFITAFALGGLLND